MKTALTLGVLGVFFACSGVIRAADTLEGLLDESATLRSKAADVLDAAQTVDDAKAANSKLSEIATQIEALADRMKQVSFVSEVAEQEATRHDHQQSKTLNERFATIGQRLANQPAVAEGLQEGLRAYRNANSILINARSSRRSSGPKVGPVESSGKFRGANSIPDWIARSADVYGGPERYVRLRIEGLEFGDERNSKLFAYLRKTFSLTESRTNYEGDSYDFVGGPVDPDASKLMRLIDLGPTEYDRDTRTITLRIDRAKFDEMFKSEPVATKPARPVWKQGDPMKQSPRRRPAAQPN